MNLRDLQYLVALAEHKHFGKAAEASFVSQPTMSTQIKKLEEMLDVQLVERGSRGVLLTDVGQLVAARARLIMAEVDAIKDHARLSKQPEAGRLTLGVFPTLAPYWLPHVVPRILQRFANLELYLIEEKTEVLIEQLHSGKIDAAVLAAPVNDDQLRSTPLFDESFVLAVPAGHPLAKRKHVNITDLQSYQLLLLDEGHCLRDQALSVCQIAGTQEMEGFRATSLETLRQMVVANIGITLLPSLATLPPVAANPGLALVRFSQPQPMRSLALYWRASSARGDFFQKLAPFLGTVPEDAVAE
jgi:LysR family transcriptional regulator, hydrogen peroxide-inducible genes activator